MSCKIIINTSVYSDDRWFVPYNTYCYKSVVTQAINACIRCSGYTGDTTHTKYYVVEVNGKDYYIPDYACVDIGNSSVDLPPADTFQNYRERWEDDTTDYIKEVKELMGIDIKKSYIPQHEGDSDTELMREVKRHHSRYEDEQED